MYRNVYKYDDMKRAEHMAVRTTVGWYLWTHQLCEVTGVDAPEFLDRLFPNNISTLKVGSARYTTMLNELGEIIDDVIIFRMETHKFWISTLFMTYLLKWLAAYHGEARVEYTNITAQYHMFAVQGPRAMDVVNAMAKNPVDEQRFFTIRANEIDGIPVYINRGGFTGEAVGYEIYLPAEHFKAMEEKLRSTAEQFGGREVTEFQVMAWTLPTEAGFYYMRDLHHTNPLEVGLDKNINWDKDFVGREALLKVREAGPAREMVGFTVDEADIHIKGRHLGNEGEVVYKDGEPVGRVAKIVYSYVLEKNNGYIIARKGALKIGDKVMMHGHEGVITERKFL